MKADSLSCKNLSAQYNLLASRNIALKNPVFKGEVIRRKSGKSASAK